jgi:hypothetical protein
VRVSRPWTSKEIAWLAANGDLGLTAAALEMDRSPKSVESAAYRFGISLKRKPALCPHCCLRPVRTASGLCRVCALRANAQRYRLETAAIARADRARERHAEREAARDLDAARQQRHRLLESPERRMVL